MIAELTYYEFLMFYRNRKLWLSLMSLLALVMLTSISSSINNFSNNQEKQKVAKIERERWLQQGEKDPHSAAHYSVYVFKPASALVVLDSGVEPFVGQAVWLEAHVQNDMSHRPQDDSTLLERTGLANPAKLLIEFVPLFVFWLVFSAVAQQKERGTLRFILSSTIAPSKFVIAKWFTVWLLILCFLVVPVMITGVISAAALQLLTADVVLRSFLWGGIMAIYFAIIIAIAMAVTLIARDARTALVMLIALWILTVLVVPRWASTRIDSSAPLPTTQSIKEQLQQEAPSYWTAEQGEAHQLEILEQYKVSKVEDLPVNYRGAELDLTERHSHQVFDRVLGNFYQQVDAQNKKFALFAIFSPTIALQYLSPAMAGSDFSHHRQFIMAAETYRRALVNRMNDEVKNHVVAPHEKHIQGASLWAQIPEFTYLSPPIEHVWKNILPVFLILLGWLLGAGLLLKVASRKFYS